MNECIDWYDRKWKRVKSYAELWKLGENPLYKIVCRNCFPDWSMISTVWIWLDHRLDKKWKPIIFETMVFSRKKKWKDYQKRYSSEKEAMVWHAIIYDEYRSLSDNQPEKWIKK